MAVTILMCANILSSIKRWGVGEEDRGGVVEREGRYGGGRRVGRERASMMICVVYISLVFYKKKFVGCSFNYYYIY